MAGQGRDPRDAERAGDAPARPAPSRVGRDEARCRFEDVLLRLPEGRAVPDLDVLFDVAGVDASVLTDERARKLLADALVGRPLGTAGAVREVRSEVELLLLEVELLTDRLADSPRSEHARGRDRQRIEAIAHRVAAIRSEL